MKQKWAIFILIAAGIVAYGNTAKNGLFWDDDEFITRNAYIRSFRYLPQWFSQPLTAGAGVNSNYYRPLLQLSFAIDYKLWGLWPAGYHFENLIWHSLAGILLFVFLNNLLPQIFNFPARNATHSVAGGQFFPQSGIPLRGTIFNQFSKLKQITISNQQLTIIAFAASLLWLVHPVHVEAVAYANSRGDSMATVFILLTLILWLKKRFWASAAVFVLALLSKEFAIVTPGLILLVESLRGVPATWQSRLIPRIKPFLVIFIIASIYILLRLTTLNFQNTLNFYGVDLTKVDQQQPLARYATSLPVRLMTFLKVLPIYGSILAWPDDLHMERTVEIATTVKDPAVLLSLSVILVSAGSFGWALIFSQRKSAGTPEPRSHALRERPANSYAVAGGRREVSVLPGSTLVFALFWFFISILPTSGLIPISQILAEHFLYLPSIGFFLIVSTTIAYIASASFRAERSGVEKSSETIKVGRHRRPRSLGYARDDGLNDSNHLTFKHLIYWLILLGISIPLTVKTIRQNRVWRDPITFYEYTLTHAQPTARVYNNLAMAYAETHEHQKAINNYQLAISMGDVYPNPHYNLGNTFIELGKLDEAEREYRRALEIDPSFHYATLKLGQIYLDQGKIDDAKNLVCPVFPTQPLCRN